MRGKIAALHEAFTPQAEEPDPGQASDFLDRCSRRGAYQVALLALLTAGAAGSAT